MKELAIKACIMEAQLDELSAEEQAVIQLAIKSTDSSYSPYSHFHVGAGLLLADGTLIGGCNQENAAFPAGICAERSAIFAAGAQHSDVPVRMLAIAARTEDGELQDDPVSPCGTCRQVIIETEKRYGQPIRILLYGRSRIYVMDGIKQLMPLSFTEF